MSPQTAAPRQGWRESSPQPGQTHTWTFIANRDQLIISLNFFIGRARTVFEAGFALNTHGSFVKGLTPFFAGLAGFRFSFMLIAPASLKDPDVLSCAAASAMYASTHSFTCLPFRPVDSPTDAYAPEAVIALDFARVAFIAFIAFVGAIGTPC